MTYSCNGKFYDADSLDGAWLMALTEQGVDAIGASVKGEKGDFSFNVCLKAYRDAFPTFTDEDYLQYEIISTRAWLEFPKVVSYELDDDWEECEVTRLCDEGQQFIYDNSKLALHMNAIGFCW